MNLTKLFNMQRKLDERIVREKGLEGRDMLPEKILALQVELGELANEWRGFKFWSKDMKPRTKALKKPTMNDEDKVYENPLLVEYVDCLHFILSIALETKTDFVLSRGVMDDFIGDDVRFQFSRVYHSISKISYHIGEGFAVIRHDDVQDIFDSFYYLGEMLGFTWEEIESAYMEKNATNHSRQDNGY